MTNPDAETARMRGGQLMRGRKFNAEELQLMLLWFLRDAPAHGYELARRFSELSRGYYSPSPGVLYPALGQLETQAFAQVELDGRRKNYRITPAGLEHARLHAGRAESLLAVLKHAAKKMLWMRQAAESEAAASDATGWLPEYVQAGNALRAALLAQDDADHATQRRVIAILQRATRDILQDTRSDEPPGQRPAMTTDMYKVQKMQHPIRTRRLEVKRVVELSPSMRRITLTGDELAGFISASFDDHVKLIVPEAAGEQPNVPTIGPDGMVFEEGTQKPAMRDYTPRRYDPVANELDIDFVLGHEGPATDWASHAEPGHPVGIAGPRGSFVVPIAFDWHLLIGDETAIPAIARRLEELPATARAIVVIRTLTEDARIELRGQCERDVRWVVGEPGAVESGAGVLLSAVRDIALPDGEGHVWAAGEYSEIRAVRRHVAEVFGLDKSRIRAASYWRRAAPNTHEHFD